MQELFYFHVSSMSHELNRENLDQSHVSLMSFCTNLPDTSVILLGKLTRFWHISYSPTMKAQASLHKCALTSSSDICFNLHRLCPLTDGRTVQYVFLIYLGSFVHYNAYFVDFAP